jgi:hypothetical protein
LLRLGNPRKLGGQQLLELVDFDRERVRLELRAISTPSATSCGVGRRCRSASQYRTMDESSPSLIKAE